MKRLGLVLLTFTVLVFSVEVRETQRLPSWWRALILLLVLLFHEYRRELVGLSHRADLGVKEDLKAVRSKPTQDQRVIVAADSLPTSAVDDNMLERGDDLGYPSGSGSTEELALERETPADTRELATSFMIGLPEELVRNQILLRIYVSQDGGISSVSALHMLCVLRLVCKSWKIWLDGSPDWVAAKKLFVEDAMAFNEELWAELGDTEDEEEEIEF
jgi:hypothetical protein